RVAARDIGLRVLLPLDAVVGMDLHRRAAVGAGQAHVLRLRGGRRERERNRKRCQTQRHRLAPSPAGYSVNVLLPVKMMRAPLSNTWKPTDLMVPNGPWPSTAWSPKAAPLERSTSAVAVRNS